jgi:hypothetical protein
MLAVKNLIDYSAALSMATERLSRDPTALAADVLVVLPEDLDLGHMELALVQAFQPVLNTYADRPGEPPDDVPELVSDASCCGGFFAHCGPNPLKTGQRKFSSIRRSQ